MQRLSQYLSYITEKKAVIFVGAGVSALAGCSGLRDILNSLKEYYLKEEIMSQKPNDTQPRQLITYCKSKIKTLEDKLKYEGIMRQCLTPDPDKYSREYLPFIKKIRCIKPFPTIITTNIDYCLTNTQEFEFQKIFYQLSDMNITNFQNGGIFHLHGYIEDKKSQTWDIFDYEKRYTLIFKRFLLEIFKNYSVLYLGYSLDDHELLQQMAKAKKQNSQPMKHFALLPKDEPHRHIYDDVYKELYNIDIIKYGSKADFVRLFQEWIDSNFNLVTMGKVDQISYLPNIKGT